MSDKLHLGQVHMTALQRHCRTPSHIKPDVNGAAQVGQMYDVQHRACGSPPAYVVQGIPQPWPMSVLGRVSPCTPKTCQRHAFSVGL